MPQSATVDFARAAGIFSTRRSRSQDELQISASARLTTMRVAALTPGTVPRFATSCPCAITTSGARPAIDANAPAAPAGKSMWVKTTSGRTRRAAPIASRLSRAYFVRDRRRWSISTSSTSWPSRSSSSRIGTRKLPKSGSSGPGHIWVTKRMRIGPDYGTREGR